MGFSAITKPSAAAGAPTAAGLTALLALARSDGASDGDTYTDTSTGRSYRFKNVGSGILLPGEWFGKVGGLKTQDSSKTSGGLCYLTIGDAEADLTARGWEFVGSPTAKTADNPLALDGSGGAQYMITSTAGTSTYSLATSEGVYIIARIKNDATHVGLTGGESRTFEISNGAKVMKASAGLSPSSLLQGRIDFGDTTANPHADQYVSGYGSSPPLLGANDGWIHMVMSDSSGVGMIERLDAFGQGIHLSYADADTTTVDQIMLFASSSGSACKTSYYEAFFFEVT